MTWLNAPDNRDDYVGMVYLITELDTNKKYVGIKRYWKKVKLKPLKGQKRKRIVKKESDWRTYNTSSGGDLQEKLISNPSNYRKEILHNCKTISEMKAREAYYILSAYFSDEWDMWFNEIVHLRVRLRKNKHEGKLGKNGK